LVPAPGGASMHLLKSCAQSRGEIAPELTSQLPWPSNDAQRLGRSRKDAQELLPSGRKKEKEHPPRPGCPCRGPGGPAARRCSSARATCCRPAPAPRPSTSAAQPAAGVKTPSASENSRLPQARPDRTGELPGLGKVASEVKLPIAAEERQAGGVVFTVAPYRLGGMTGSSTCTPGSARSSMPSAALAPACTFSPSHSGGLSV